MDLDALGLGTNFSTLDWVIVAVYLIATVAIGLYANRYIANMTDYIVAGRSLRSYLGVATMIGTELGLVTVMYASQAGFLKGFAAFHVALVAGVVTLLVGLTGFIVVPLRRMGVMTIPEFYEKRFSRGVRVVGACILVASGVLNMGLFLKIGSIFVAGLTGMTSQLQVNIVMTVLLALVLVYTVLGGMVSVIITDYIQFIVLSAGLLLACVLATRTIGWDNTVETLRSIRGESGMNPLDRNAFGPLYPVWITFVGLAGCAVWQTAVMRACAMENAKLVKRLFVWSSVGFLVRWLLPCFLGVCALTYCWQNPQLKSFFFDEHMEPVVTASPWALPVFLSQILPAGVIGLIGAAMLAAFMSSHDSYLLCWSSVVTQDIVAPLFGERLSTRRRLLITRAVILLVGLFLLVWGLWYPLDQSMWSYMAISGAIYFTSAFALLAFGLYWKSASTAGAYMALACGFTAIVALGPVSRPLGLKKIAAALDWGPPDLVLESIAGLGALVLACIAMVVGSLIFPDRNRRSHLREIEA